MSRDLGLKEIAAVTGVSLSTVSRALKDDPRISPVTRRKVRAAVELLSSAGQPRIAGPVLRDAATCIALVLPEEDGWVGDTEVSITVLECLQETCETHQRTAITTRLRPGASGRAALGLGTDMPVGGIIGYRLHDTDVATLSAAAREIGLPFVFLNRVETEPGGISLAVDHEEAGRLAARHLQELGHRRIGAIFTHPDIQSSRLRLQGVREALQGLASPLEPSLVRLNVDDLAGARAAADELVALGATALIVDSDRRAIAAMNHLQKQGVAIPRAISMVGFDGTQGAELTDPPLTSVYTPWREMTQTAARLLIECNRDPLIREGRLLWRPRLNLGASCAAPAGAGT